jgi:hypothetical protein
LATSSEIFVTKTSATPSGPKSFIAGLAAWTSVKSWTPLFWVMPPKNRQSAPLDFTLVASERKFAALVSMPSLPAICRPCALARFSTYVARPFP